MPKKKYYAVAIGKQPGIYTQWEGDLGAARQVDGFPGAKYKGFASVEAAQEWLTGSPKTPTSVPDEKVQLYTDGSCLANPGPGGCAAIIKQGCQDQELTAGFRMTTNNRMELLACILGLQALPDDQAVEVYTDSSYLVNGITKGWAARWKANAWMRNRYEKADNADLWERLLHQTSRHRVTFHWVRGHAGHPENERCDRLALQAASRGNLPPDTGYAPGS